MNKGFQFFFFILMLSLLLIIPATASQQQDIIHPMSGENYVFYSAVSIVLVILAGLMSGLTVGLLSIDSLELEMKSANGTDLEKI